jgi:hypothetical protein
LVWRRRVKTKLMLLGLGIVLAATLVVGGCRGGSAPQQQGTAPPVAPPGEPAKPAAAAQTAEVPVVIEAYYPMNESHKFIADYLKSVEAANPGKVKVSVYDMQSEEGRRKWAASGLSCAGVFVNGKTSYELTTDGKTETVAFLQRMEVNWTHQDFERVVKQILEKAGETFTSPNYQPKPAAPAAAPAAQPEAKPGASGK